MLSKILGKKKDLPEILEKNTSVCGPNIINQAINRHVTHRSEALGTTQLEECSLAKSQSWFLSPGNLATFAKRLAGKASEGNLRELRPHLIRKCKPALTTI